MRRREFIALVGSAAAATRAAAAKAQQAQLPVIGFLSSTSMEAYILAAFRRGLSEQGYVEGRDVVIEYRSAEGRFERLPALAAELVTRDVNVLVALPSTPAALAAKAATSRIPIVFYLGIDPVELGLVASYNMPGGNATGVSLLGTLTPKLLELLDWLLPRSAPMAFLVNPTHMHVDEERKLAEETSRVLGRELILVGAGTESEIDAAFETLIQRGAKGLAIWQEAYLLNHRHQIVALAQHHKIPTIFSNRLAATEAGGLMSYGTNPSEYFRQVGVYVGKILKGASPADLPVLQPTTYELVINLKTAKALGITIPPTLIARADEVIE
jgi:putative ABC transport system substrate-binding protein